MDLIDDTNDVKFVMTKEIFEQVGDIKVELTPGGYMVKPAEQEESSCGSCSGSCG